MYNIIQLGYGMEVGTRSWLYQHDAKDVISQIYELKAVEGLFVVLEPHSTFEWED